MKNHERNYLRLISAYIDQELEGKQRLSVEAHLRSCDQCRDAVKSFQQLKEIGSRVPEHSVNPYYLTRLKAAIERRREVSGEAVVIEARLLAPMLGLFLIAVAVTFFILRGEKAVSPEDYLYLMSKQTAAEQQVLLRPTPFSKEEVLLLAVSNNRGEELNGR